MNVLGYLYRDIGRISPLLRLGFCCVNLVLIIAPLHRVVLVFAI